MGLGGLAWALIDINAFPMMLDISPGADGTAAGVYFIATTLAATIGPILNGWLIDLSGRNYGLIFIIGPLFFLLSFLCMIGVRHGEAHV
jgi:MFS family permease